MNEVLLGIIAFAVLVMAGIQVGAIVVAARLAKRVDRLALQIEQDLRPTFTNLTALTADAARAASLAAAQVERADRMFGEWAQRVDHTLTVAQNTVLGPAREGLAVIAAVKAALAALRGFRETSRRRASPVDEEDALFIG